MLKKVEENGSPDIINRLCGHLNEILNFAINSGLIESNTCLKISSTFKSVRQRNNPRISIEEIPNLIKSMICTPKVGLNNQLTKLQIFYDQIQHSFQTTSHRILSSK